MADAKSESDEETVIEQPGAQDEYGAGVSVYHLIVDPRTLPEVQAAPKCGRGNGRALVEPDHQGEVVSAVHGRAPRSVEVGVR